MVGGEGKAPQRLTELADGEALVQRGQLAADRAPDLLLGGLVVDDRRGLSGAPGERGRGDLAAAAALAGVVGAGVAVVEVDGDLTAGARRHRRVQLGFLEHCALLSFYAEGRPAALGLQV